MSSETNTPDDFFTVEQQAAYDSTFAALNEPSKFWHPFRKGVRGRGNHQPTVSGRCITPSRGHHELYRALEVLEGLEKEVQTLAIKTPFTCQLTELVTGEVCTDSQEAIQLLEVLGQAVPRRICQQSFKKSISNLPSRRNVCALSRVLFAFPP